MHDAETSPPEWPCAGRRILGRAPVQRPTSSSACTLFGWLGDAPRRPGGVATAGGGRDRSRLSPPDDGSIEGIPDAVSASRTARGPGVGWPSGEQLLVGYRRSERPLRRAGSASPRPRPASCTSAAPAPRCSTGSSPATTAARSSCASRTPTSNGPARSWTEAIQTTLRWLGLDWDEGPYLQSARFDRLPGRRPTTPGEPAPPTSASAPRRRSRRRYEARRAAGPADPGYDGHCRDLTRRRAGGAGGGRVAPVGPVPHPRRRRQLVHGRDPGGGRP